jgi:hypothetical protein
MTTIQTITPLLPQQLPALPYPPTNSAGAGSSVEFTHSSNGSDAVKLNISPSSRLQSDRDIPIALGNRARDTDATFERALDLVKDMKAQVTAITKQFPPFATDSDERIRYLNSFSSLRKQVEALTFPSEPEAVGAWNQVQFPAKDMNLGIPSLDPITASDQEVFQAEADLELIHADLTRQRVSLYDSVMAALGDHSDAEQALMLSQEVRDRLVS